VAQHVRQFAIGDPEHGGFKRQATWRARLPDDCGSMDQDTAEGALWHEPSDITWYNGRTREVSHGAILGMYEDSPLGIKLNWLNEKQTFDAMLDRGDIDAATGFYPSRRADAVRNFIDVDRYGGTPIEGNPRIRKLVADGGRELMVAYHKKTGIIPVNHMLIVQQRILAEHPWVALEIYKAFQRSKEVAFERTRDYGAAYLLFADSSFQDQARIFGQDPYPQGVNANRKMLEVLFQGSFTQGLTKKMARIDDIFYPTTLDT
jgi:4,5-dihydroxyphthalate decarboxylase